MLVVLYLRLALSGCVVFAGIVCRADIITRTLLKVCEESTAHMRHPRPSDVIARYAQQTRDSEPMSVYCWVSVVDAGRH